MGTPKLALKELQTAQNKIINPLLNYDSLTKKIKRVIMNIR